MAHLFLETLAMPILLFSGGGRVSIMSRRVHVANIAVAHPHLPVTSPISLQHQRKIIAFLDSDGELGDGGEESSIYSSSRAIGKKALGVGKVYTSPGGLQRLYPPSPTLDACPAEPLSLMPRYGGPPVAHGYPLPTTHSWKGLSVF
jgi:hypothetical protein